MPLGRNLVGKNRTAASQPKIALWALAGLGIMNLVIAGQAQGALFDRGNGLIDDSSPDITWLADVNYAATSGYDLDGRMNWAGVPVATTAICSMSI